MNEITNDLGILLDTGTQGVSPDWMQEMAVLAEARGLDLVTIASQPPGEHADARSGLDPWMVATWIAARTRRIAIGVDVPVSAQTAGADVETPYPAVIARVHASLDVLAPGRIVSDASLWTVAPAGATREEIVSLAQRGRPVVVPVTSAGDVERLAELFGTADRPRSRRSAAARAKRMPGIAYDAIPESLVDAAIEPGDPGYRAVSSTYMRGGAPGIVLQPGNRDEVAEAIAFARRHPALPLGIRSGGHGISGRSTNRGGIVIDLHHMNAIEVIDAERRLVRIEPGATWKQVAAALQPYGWALGSGDYGGVGVGGLATAGGIGYLGREHGLTIDHLRAVELVLADGSHVRASEDEHPDLFWAVRGAGANFGIATGFEFEVSDIGDVGFAYLTFVTDDLEDSLHAFGRIASEAPRDTTLFLIAGRPRGGQTVIQLIGVVDQPDPGVVVERLTPFLGVGTLAQQQVVMTSYRNVMDLAQDPGADGHAGYGEPVSRSAFVPAVTPAFAHDMAEVLESGLVHFFSMRTMGGAIADIPPDRTAFAHRSAGFAVAAMGGREQALTAAWERMRHHFEGMYLSFETDRRPERLLDAFPPAVLARLVGIKRRYDPANLFRDNFNIDPQLDVDGLARAAITRTTEVSR